MKILFITHEGIDSSIFNSQVLIHATSLMHDGVFIDVLCYNTNRKTKILSINNYTKLLHSNPNVNIILKPGFNIHLPFSSFLNGLLLAFFLLNHKKKYSILHCRSDYTTLVAIISKFIHKKKIIWDCRGDSLNELNDVLLKKNIITRFLGRFFLMPFNKLGVLISSKFSDASIFVSKALYNLHSDNLRSQNYKIIPCPVSEELFFFDVELRVMNRKENKINDDELVFLYSGSLASYQALNLQEDFYRQILKDPKNIIIFATVDVNKAREYFLNKFDHRFLILNIPFSEMNCYYNLADFAILLREKKQLNYVASPTKFGEYCLSGLPVIMNDTIEQSFEFSNNIGNYLNIDRLNFEKFNNESRSKIATNSSKYFSRNELNKLYLELYYSI